MRYLTKDGKRFAIEEVRLEALLSTIGKRGAPLFICACIKDGVVCHGEYKALGLPGLLCNCCQNHGKSFGGGRTYCTQHVRVTSVADLVHERLAVELLRQMFKGGSWTVVRKPEPKLIYDWADPDTGRVGQCWTDQNGRWIQEPLGQKPVVCAFKKPRRAVA